MLTVPKIEVLQDCTGTFFIRDTQGNQIVINTNELDANDLRSILNGIGNLMQGIAATLWNKKLAITKSRDK